MHDSTNTYLNRQDEGALLWHDRKQERWRVSLKHVRSCRRGGGRRSFLELDVARMKIRVAWRLRVVKWSRGSVADVQLSESELWSVRDIEASCASQPERRFKGFMSGWDLSDVPFSFMVCHFKCHFSLTTQEVLLLRVHSLICFLRFNWFVILTP